jgi:hypothetical protein
VQKENEGCCLGHHFLRFRGMKEEGEDGGECQYE